MYQKMEELLSYLKNSERNYDIEKIIKAYEYADTLHDGQFRLSGEPYISHPVAVAAIVAELGLDSDSICAALLHDTVEDCADKTSLEQITKMFSKDVSMLVDGLTKIISISEMRRQIALSRIWLLEICYKINLIINSIKEINNAFYRFFSKHIIAVNIHHILAGSALHSIVTGS